MSSLFSKIGILGKPGDPKVDEAVRVLVDHLLGQHLEVVTHAQDTGPGTQTSPGLDARPLPGWGADCHLVIVVGGDGTLLRAARILAESSIPLLGISLGRLGFLVDISPGKMLETIDQVLAGDFDEEPRFLLMARSGRSPELGASALALNDVVLHKWNTARMIEFETYIDGQFVNIQRADGLIVSTPTGSTAYALSGGGPLLHPQLNALELVPICPHTLSSRPIVIAGDSRIEIHLRGRDHEHVHISCDGQTHLPMSEGEKLYIRKHHHPVRLLHPKGYDHYRVLRAKLGWGGHPHS